MQDMEKDAPYTASEAAQLLGVDVQRIYRMIQRGQLKVFPVHGKATLITAASVAELKKQRGLEDRS